MMVVIAIIGALALVVGPSVVGNVTDARIVSARNQIEVFAVALEAYRVDTGSYPSTGQGLNALWDEPGGPGATPGWRGPYLRKSVPVDPWKRPYVYRSPGTASPRSYDILTLGRDGLVGGEDEDSDVTSWDGSGL